VSNILSPRGQRMVEVGGDRCWLQRVLGEFVVSYQWLHVPGKKEPAACMTIFPTTRRMDAGAFVILQDNAWAYATSAGDATPQLIASCFGAVIDMGYAVGDKHAQNKLITIILEGLSDLVRMPSEQPDQLNIKRAVLGIEATARVGGEIINQEVL
jgi:hypothetical protein